MSSYLFALVIGKFDKVSMETKSGVKVSVYVPIGKKDDAAFALESAGLHVCIILIVSQYIAIL